MSLVALPIEVLWMVVRLGELGPPELKSLRQTHPALARFLAPMVLERLKLKAIHFRYANRFAKDGASGISRHIRTLMGDSVGVDFKGLPRVITVAGGSKNYLSPGFNEAAIKTVLNGFENLHTFAVNFDVALMKNYIFEFFQMLGKCWPQDNTKMKLHVTLTRLQNPFFGVLSNMPPVDDLRISGWVDQNNNRGKMDHDTLREAIQKAIRRSPNITSLSVNFRHMSINSVFDMDKNALSTLQGVNNEGCLDGLSYHRAAGLTGLKELYVEWYKIDEHMGRYQPGPWSPFPRFQEIGTKLTCLRTKMMDETLLDYLLYAKDSIQDLELEVLGAGQFKWSDNEAKLSRLYLKFWRQVFPAIQHNLRKFRLVPFKEDGVKDLRTWSQPRNHAAFIPQVSAWSASEFCTNFNITKTHKLESITMFLFYSKTSFDNLMDRLEQCPNLKKINLCVMAGPNQWGYVTADEMRKCYTEIEDAEHGKRRLSYDVEMDVNLWGYYDPWWRHSPLLIMKEYSWGDLGWEGRRGASSQ